MRSKLAKKVFDRTSYATHKEVSDKTNNLVLKTENTEDVSSAELDRDRQAKEMVLWMREHHPESILSFYKMYDEKFPERTK